VPVLIDAETAIRFSAPITLVSVLLGSAVILIAYISLSEAFERDLAKKADQAKRAERVKSNFLANVTHEIRTPLSSVLGLAGLLKDAEKDPGRRLLARNLVDVSSNLLSIVNDLLDGAKLDAGKLDVKNEAVDLVDIIGSVCNTMRINAHMTKVKLFLNYDCSLPRYICSDAVRLRQVLLNLVSNAVKFSRPDATGREGLVSIEVKRISEGQIAFEVVDNGIGMTDKVMENLFEPFQQADETISSEFGGTGLGLSIVKSLVMEMGGSIFVDSEKDKGSVFKVILPLSSKPGPTLKKDYTASCILFYENAQLAKLVQYYLEGAGIKVKPANSVTDIEQHVSDGMDTLLILDLHNESLQKVLKNVTGRIHDLRIIGMTSDPEIMSLPGVYQVIHSTPLVPSELWDALRIPEKKDRTTKDKSFTRNVSVLVVEDDKLCRTVLSQQIEKLGGTTAEAASLAEAMKRISERPYDLILTDCGLPDGTGPELAMKLRSHFSEQNEQGSKIIAVTGHSTDEFKEECLNSGMDGFETKPVHIGRLKELMEGAKQ